LSIPKVKHFVFSNNTTSKTAKIERFSPDHVIRISSGTASTVSAEGTAHVGGEMVGKIRNVKVAFHAEVFFCWLAGRTI